MFKKLEKMNQNEIEKASLSYTSTPKNTSRNVNVYKTFDILNENDIQT